MLENRQSILITALSACLPLSTSSSSSLSQYFGVREYSVISRRWQLDHKPTLRCTPKSGMPAPRSISALALKQ
ncbi:hypothetical protein V8C44DRAFT_334303 [Trichoderma aethiopicum]